MRNSDSLLAAITSGDVTEDTISAALDSLREDRDCTLLAAVLEVANAYTAAKSAEEISEAQTSLLEGGPVWRALRLSIMRACLNLSADTFSWIMVTAGGDQPLANFSIDNGTTPVGQIACVLVGARWVLRERDRLMKKRDQRLERDRRRRSR